MLGALGGYILSKKAYNKYGNKDDSLEKYGTRYAGTVAGSVLSHALYNKASGNGFNLKTHSK